jgi:hypothetical protein
MNNGVSGRTSFREHIPEIAYAADLLDRAADAHLGGDEEVARDLIREANLPVLRTWLESIWGKGSPHIHARPDPTAPRVVASPFKQRMPGMAQKRLLIERDGHHCRLCGMPVIRAEVRNYLGRIYGQALPWGNTNATQHAAFQLFWLQYDHLLPYARGGTNEVDNVFIACAACNYGRMNWTLTEVGFAPLESIAPTRSAWDGLERVLPAGQRLSRKTE